MPASTSIFPTFFLSGFECSTFDWKDCGRRDLAAAQAALGEREKDR